MTMTKMQQDDIHYAVDMLLDEGRPRHTMYTILHFCRFVMGLEEAASLSTDDYFRAANTPRGAMTDMCRDLFTIQRGKSVDKGVSNSTVTFQVDTEMFQVDTGMAAIFAFLLNQDRAFWFEMMLAVEYHDDRIRDRESDSQMSKNKMAALDCARQLRLLSKLIDISGNEGLLARQSSVDPGMSNSTVTFHVGSEMAAIFAFLLSQKKHFWTEMICSVHLRGESLKNSVDRSDRHGKKQMDIANRLMVLGDLIHLFTCGNWDGRGGRDVSC